MLYIVHYIEICVLYVLDFGINLLIYVFEYDESKIEN